MNRTSSALIGEGLEALLDEIRGEVEETAYLTNRLKLDIPAATTHGE
jgi:hypothetical protein